MNIDASQEIHCDRKGFIEFSDSEEAMLALLADGLGDGDGIPEADDLAVPGDAFAHSPGTWKELGDISRQRLTVDWVRSNAPWALDALRSPLKKNRVSSETRNGLLMWLAVQMRASHHRIRVIPKWIPDGMNGTMLSLKFEPASPPTVKAPTHIVQLAGSLLGPFFMSDQAIALAQEGYTVISVDGPSGPYSDGARNITATAPDYKTGFGYTDGSNRERDVQIIIDNLLEAWGIVDPHAAREGNTIPYLFIAYSYGATQLRNWFDYSDSPWYSNYIGALDFAGGWKLKPGTTYAAMVSLLSQKNGSGVFDLGSVFGSGSIADLVDSDIETTDDVSRYLTKLYLTASGIKESYTHVHDEMGLERTPPRPGEAGGRKIAILSSPDDEGVSQTGTIQGIGERIPRNAPDGFVQVYIVGSKPEATASDEGLQSFLDAIAADKRFTIAKWVAGSPHEFGHVLTFNPKVHSVVLEAVEGLQRSSDSAMVTARGGYPSPDDREPYWVSFHRLIKGPASERSTSLDAAFDNVENLLRNHDIRSDFPSADTAGWFEPNKPYARHVVRMAYYLALHHPDAVDDPALAPLFTAASHLLRHESADSEAQKNGGDIGDDYLKALHASYQGYIDHHDMPAHELARMATDYKRVADALRIKNEDTEGDITAINNEIVWAKRKAVFRRAVRNVGLYAMAGTESNTSNASTKAMLGLGLSYDVVPEAPILDLIAGVLGTADAHAFDPSGYAGLLFCNALHVDMTYRPGDRALGLGGGIDLPWEWKRLSLGANISSPDLLTHDDAWETQVLGFVLFRVPGL